ncbi:MAG TPA: hypothetical protein VFP72_13995 [Kineosporiaceae bacterium]|nr:hypothetical protein [Kineosporiaceae bacterium]
MSSTEVFLFALFFLLSGVLAAWVRYLHVELSRRPHLTQLPRRDPEIVRLGELLASATARVEALERQNGELAAGFASHVDRHGDLARILADAAGVPRVAVHGSAAPDQPSADAGGSTPSAAPARADTTADTTAGLWPQAGPVPAAPDPERAEDPVRVAPDPDRADPEEEVSASQWRSAMDRLGPAWGSAARLTDPPERTPSQGVTGTTPGRDEDRGSPWARRSAALDDLFAPPSSARSAGADADRTLRPDSWSRPDGSAAGGGSAAVERGSGSGD